MCYVNDPALKGGACDSPEVQTMAEAVSFLVQIEKSSRGSIRP